MTTTTTTFDEFVVQLQKKFGPLPELKLKYIVDYNRAQLLDLVDGTNLHDLVIFCEKYAYIYVFPVEDASRTSYHEEQHCDINCSSVEVLGHNIDHLVSNAPIGSDKTNSATTCTQAEQQLATSELWKNEIYGSGQTFTNVIVFRTALYRYSIAHKFNYKFLNNSTHMMWMQCCVEGCPWCLNANQIRNTRLLRVGQFIKEHSHSSQDVITAKSKARSKLAASIISTRLRTQPDTTPNEIKDVFSTDFNMDMTYKQACQFKEQSMRVIHGMPNDSYRFVLWLCKKIKEEDENATTTYEASSYHRFVRVFVAYGCSILGFLSGCCPILFIDGCHLSGPYKGSLLSDIAFDADNQLFPLAYAIVASEKYDDWFWFLTKLKKATRSVDVTIMSDRHKNILSSVAQIFGKENHGYCYRHIKENFSFGVSKLLPRTKKAKENGLKLLDDVMYARLDIDFQRSLKNLRTFEPKLTEWVLQNQPKRWVMSKFSKRRWDQVTTNVAESFNAWVMNERRHYVFAFINEHHDRLASKLFKAKEDMELWKNGVGSNTEGKLLKNVAREEFMRLMPYGQYSAKVNTGYVDLNVNLEARTCTCFEWQMSGVPCSHACATIKKLNGNLYEYVEDWYKLLKQELVYSNLMVPIETHDMLKKRHDHY